MAKRLLSGLIGVLLLNLSVQVIANANNYSSLKIILVKSGLTRGRVMVIFVPVGPFLGSAFDLISSFPECILTEL